METIDAVVMGRKSFETVASFPSWPYSKTVYILSSTLSTVPPHLASNDKIIILTGLRTAAEVVSICSSNGHKRLYIDGGVTIQKFIEARLLSSIVISTIPVLLGEGRPLFTKTGLGDIWLSHQYTKSWPHGGGLVQNRYSINYNTR
jgi:dihydrofolate reductase